MAGAISMRISHGYTIDMEGKDPLISLVERGAEEFYVATMPGKWLVDTLPFLAYIPKWLPGMGFKRQAEIFRKHHFEQTDRPHMFVKSAILEGTALPSFTSTIMQTQVDKETEYATKFAAMAIYGGGSDPVVATIHTFIILMALHPDVQENAKKEIKSIIGNNRLPTFSDRLNLPYIDALLKEVLRFHTVGRTGIPHRATKDDIYEGYLIPRNSIVIPHMWHITHDPVTYHNPSQFLPSRFISEHSKPPELDPATFMYGFGKRVCPGITLAQDIVFIASVMTLTVFKIEKMDEMSSDTEFKCEFGAGTVSHPKPLPVKFIPDSMESQFLLDEISREPRGQSDARLLSTLAQ
ncbi:cytochrome P450 [Cyathus striatus]|nr:cytochrome P450 [Cyathus striatus]